MWFKFSPHGDHKANVGLNLKFNKKNEEVPGYTKKVGSEWMYSSAAEQLLAEYMERWAPSKLLPASQACIAYRAWLMPIWKGGYVLQEHVQPLTPAQWR